MEWRTEKRRVSELVPYAHNPRTLTTKQAADLKKSLNKFSLVEIPVINVDNTIIAGHQRIQLLGESGDKEIDVRVPDRLLTENELQEYNIRSNKNTGEWDFDVLANSFDMEDLKEWGFEDSDFKIFGGIEDEEETEAETLLKPTINIVFTNNSLLQAAESEIQEVVNRMDQDAVCTITLGRVNV